uniref:Annexin n=1 Tax=Caenorhabditis tropicalis TaxID=1561998 RepID=A0A1I7V4Z4_9PELO
MATAKIHFKPFFDEVLASESLEKALRNKEKLKVLEILVSVNNTQRQMIRTPYKTRYGKDLEEEIKKAFSGDFEDFLVALLQTPTKLDVTELNRAVKGLGTNEKNLIEILTTRTNEEIEGAKNTYFMTYGKSLEDAISADTSGDFRRLLIVILQAKREESGFADSFKVGTHAAQILKSFDKKNGIEKFDAFKIFATSNGAHIQKVVEEVERQSGKDFQKIVDKELSGDFKNLILSLIETSRNKPRFLANSIHLATKGMGTRDKDLIRILVSRSENDLVIIEHEFQVLFGKPLTQLIKEECKAEYRDGLTMLVKGNTRPQ